MRHNKKFNHLGRTASHRAAMLANMAISLIMHKRITTTLPKAKELKKFIEPLLTKSKQDTTNARRVVFSHLWITLHLHSNSEFLFLPHKQPTAQTFFCFSVVFP